MNQPLHVKYRPSRLADVVGQPAAVKALGAALRERSSHAFLFTGPSGVGKTTLARIAATELGCAEGNVVEVDAASNSGADQVRELVSNARHMGFGENPTRAVIIDECHSLSKQAWQVLLKPLEEPPEHLFFMLCTTEPSKVPATIETRCQVYRLQDVAGKAIAVLLEHVIRQENMAVEDDVFDKVVDAARGSPRRALTLLSKVTGLKGRDADDALGTVDEDDPEVIDLCRAIANNEPWPDVMRVVKALPAENHEGTRIVVARYLASCAIGAKNARAAQDWAHMLACFSQPFNASDGIAPLVLAIAQAMGGRGGRDGR